MAREAVVDLNVDAGESFGPYRIGADEEVLPHVTSANVACAFHAGDPVVMRKTVRLAQSYGVRVGAHPGYHDLEGFGRRVLPISPEELVPALLYQIGALQAIAAAEEAALQHVKAHGALYNVAVRDAAVAGAVIEAVRATGLILVVLGGSAWAGRAREAGVRVAEEAFVDRGYQADGSLVPRDRPDALVTDPALAAARAVRMVREGVVRAVTGEEVPVRVDTLCVHSDTPGAPAIARSTRTALREAGIRVAPMGEWLQ